MVFLLNVVAFMLMGLQARTIVGHMPRARLADALVFGALVVLAVVASRLVVTLIWNRLACRFATLRGGLPASTVRQSVLVGWSGMRGLVTLATAFALPERFPQRDLVVLTAFAVVLGTLVLQGLSLTPLKPLIRLLKLDQMEDAGKQMADARLALARTGLAVLSDRTGPDADNLRHRYTVEMQATGRPDADAARVSYCKVGRAAIAAEREELDDFRTRRGLSSEAFYELQESLDWRELSLMPEEDRRMEES